jgi:hypothetical protein
VYAHALKDAQTVGITKPDIQKFELYKLQVVRTVRLASDLGRLPVRLFTAKSLN